MKIRTTVTFVVDTEVDDLEVYEATTLDEAVANQKQWFDADPGTAVELAYIAENVSISVEGIE